MENPNLEMRKIKSLNFLYEISEDGRIVRNVKSKKQQRIFVGNGERYVNIRIKHQTVKRTVNSLLRECWNTNTGNKLAYITAKRDEGLKVFSSLSQCANALACEYSVNPDTVRSKLKQRRKHIYDYDIIYSIAET